MRGADYWNERYAQDGFVFGTEPNTFLAEHASLLEGPVLSLSEGEGRNAVFLASRGLEVVGVDISSVALAKARRLAWSVRPLTRRKIAPSTSRAAISFGQEKRRCRGLGAS